MNPVFFPALLLAFGADIRGCVCDVARPETMTARVCSLTAVAAADRTPDAVLFEKDANPTKPHRVLAIPHAPRRTLNLMTAGERDVFWTAAIAHANSLWGNRWGIAVNGEKKRSQCQLHAHIGKLLEIADRTGGTLVNGPADIPLPDEGLGIWLHPEDGKLRVHNNEMAGELNLMR